MDENLRQTMQGISASEPGEPFMATVTGAVASGIPELRNFLGTWLRPSPKSGYIVPVLDRRQAQTELEKLAGSLALQGVTMPERFKIATEDQWSQLLALAMAGYATLVHRK